MLRISSIVGAVLTAGLVALPATALAYPPPEEPAVEILDDPTDVVPGEPVAVQITNFLPGSEATFTVSGAGVDGETIGLTAPGGGEPYSRTSESRSIDVPVGGDGNFVVDVVFPVEASYTITAEGFDADGEATTVTATLDVTEEGGLPGTGFDGRDLAIGGLALVGAGIAAVVLARRRTSHGTAA